MKRLFFLAICFLIFFGCATGGALKKDIRDASQSAGKWSDYADYDYGVEGALQDADTFLFLDPSDTTLAATGTQKEIPWSELKKAIGGGSIEFDGLNTKPSSDPAWIWDDADADGLEDADKLAGKFRANMSSEVEDNEIADFAFTYLSDIDNPSVEHVWQFWDGSEHTLYLGVMDMNLPTTWTVNDEAGYEYLAFDFYNSNIVGVSSNSAEIDFGTLDITAATFDSGNGDYELQDAGDAAKGFVELATVAETDTGTDTGRVVTPDGLAGSNYGEEVVGILVFDDSEDTAIGDGAGDVFFRIPSKLNGWDLVEVAAQVQTAGVTGNLDIMVYNVTDAADFLSTAMRVETGETDTITSAQPGTINTATDDVATGDSIRIDVDSVQTTAAKGLYVELTFRLP